jgi:hypothetical protein
MADKKRDILEFVEQSNFEQFTPTRNDLMIQKDFFRNYFDGLMKSLNFTVSVFQGAKNFLNKPSNKN